jgi:hypothetical protein
MSKSLLSKIGLALSGLAVGAMATFYAISSQKSPIEIAHSKAEDIAVSHITENNSEKIKKKIKADYLEKIVGKEGIREIHAIPRQDRDGLIQPTANLSLRVKPNYSKRNIYLEYSISPQEEIPRKHFERMPLPQLIPWLNDSATSVLVVHPEGTRISLNQKLTIQSKADFQTKENAIPFKEADKMSVTMYLGKKVFDQGAEYLGIPTAETTEIMEKIVSLQSKIEEESLRKTINEKAIITRIPLYILDKLGYSPVGREINIQIEGKKSEEKFSSWVIIPQIGIGNHEYGFGSLEKRMYRMDFDEVMQTRLEEKIEPPSFLDLKNKIILPEGIFKFTEQIVPEGKKIFLSSEKSLDALDNKKNPLNSIDSKKKGSHFRTMSPNDGIPEIMLVLDGGFRRINQTRSRSGERDYATKGTLYIVIDHDAIKRLKNPEVEWELDSDNSRPTYTDGSIFSGKRYHQEKLSFKKTQYEGIYTDIKEFKELPSMEKMFGKDAVIKDYKANPNVKMSFSLHRHFLRNNPFNLEK